MNNKNTNRIRTFLKDCRHKLFFALIVVAAFILGILYDVTNWHKPATEQDYIDMERIVYTIFSNPTEPIPPEYTVMIHENQITVKKKNVYATTKATWENNQIVTERTAPVGRILYHIMTGVLFGIIATLALILIIYPIIDSLSSWIRRGAESEYS